MGPRRSTTEVRSGGDLEGAREQIIGSVRCLLLSFLLRWTNRTGCTYVEWFLLWFCCSGFEWTLRCIEMEGWALEFWSALRDREGSHRRR